MAFIVPPGGFAGFNQMTSASRAALTPRGGGGGVRRRRKAKGTRKAKRATRGKARKSKLKFGSPAWRKKFMKKRG